MRQEPSRRTAEGATDNDGRAIETYTDDHGPVRAEYSLAMAVPVR
jgi:hypothetical protein